MTVFGVSMVKDEADIIEGTLRHMADEVDHLLVVDNGSTDGTRDILAHLAKLLPLTVRDDFEVGYYQSRKMTAYARIAAEMGAEWIVPFDADELWLFRGHTIAHDLKSVDVDVVTADLFNHFPSAVDPDGKSPFETIVWRQRDPAPLPKVAFRWHPDAVIHQGNHGVDLPEGARVAPGLEIRHFPYRNAEQFVRKARNGAAAYRATTGLPQDAGQHWIGYGRIIEQFGEQTLIDDVFKRWFWALSPADMGWVMDPAPWLRWRT